MPAAGGGPDLEDVALLGLWRQSLGRSTPGHCQDPTGEISGMGLSRQSEPGKSSWVLMRVSSFPVIRLGFFLAGIKQGPQGEHLQVPLLHQFQPWGIGLLRPK